MDIIARVLFILNCLTLVFCHCGVKGLSTKCSCLLLPDDTLNIHCTGTDIVSITSTIPNNTSIYRYTALERQIALHRVDFSHLGSSLLELYVDRPPGRIYSRNSIQNIPRNSQNVFHSLRRLRVLSINVRWHLIDNLPALFENLLELEVLDLSHTQRLQSDGLALAFQGFKNNVKIHTLNLWNIRKFGFFHDDMKLNYSALFSPFLNCPLKNINLGYNSIQSLTPGLILATPHLEHLIISNNFLYPFFDSTLMIELLTHPRLISVDASEQGYGPPKHYTIKQNHTEVTANHHNAPVLRRIKR